MMDAETSIDESPSTTSKKLDDEVEVADVKYEYLDHTADVQFHSWGDTLGEAIEQLLVAMYAYMALDITSVDRVYSMEFEASGSDNQSLVYNLMDDCLYNFNAEPYFIARSVRVISFDESNFSVKVRAWGESFDLRKHHPGTEIKAITYSNMQINPNADRSRFDIYVVVDI